MRVAMERSAPRRVPRAGHDRWGRRHADRRMRDAPPQVRLRGRWREEQGGASDFSCTGEFDAEFLAGAVRHFSDSRHYEYTEVRGDRAVR